MTKPNAVSDTEDINKKSLTISPNPDNPRVSNSTNKTEELITAAEDSSEDIDDFTISFSEADLDSEQSVSDNSKCQFELGKLRFRTNKRSVYSALLIDSESRVLVEKYSYSNPEKNVDEFQKKVVRLSQIKHPNIIRIIDYQITDKDCCIIEDFNLRYTLQDKLSNQMTFSYASRIVIQIADAVRTVIKENIYPQNLIPSNIYFSDNNTPILSGFDLGFGIEDYTYINENYISPEFKDENIIRESSYIFSLGAILFEMLTGKKFYIDNYPENCNYKDLNLSDEISEILTRSLSKNSQKRYQSIDEFISVIDTAQKKLCVISLNDKAKKQYSEDKKENLQKERETSNNTTYNNHSKRNIVILSACLAMAFIFIIARTTLPKSNTIETVPTNASTEKSINYAEIKPTESASKPIIRTLTITPDVSSTSTIQMPAFTGTPVTIAENIQNTPLLSPTNAETSVLPTNTVIPTIPTVNTPTLITKTNTATVMSTEELTATVTKSHVATTTVPTSTVINTPTIKPTKAIPNVGNVIEFGNYEQDNIESNGKEEISWKVLDVQEGNVLLVSTQILDARRFHNQSQIKGGWAESDLRKWLMNDFYNTAFSKQEQDVIVIIPQRATTKDTSDDMDSVFVLSVEQIKKYLPGTSDRQFLATTYAIQKGKVFKGADGYYNWWTRSNHIENGRFWIDGIDIVRKYGEIWACNPTDSDLGVLPAIWINIEKYLDLE